MLAAEPTLYRVAKTMLRSGHDYYGRGAAGNPAGLTEQLDSLRSTRYFKTWLVRILINECSTILRRQQRLAPYDAAAAEAIPTPAADDYSDLYAAITALEEKLRLPVELYYLEGFKTREVAGMLGIPEKHGQDPSPSGKRSICAKGLERSVLRMMNHNDFPKMTEEFDRSVRRALDSLPERESKPVRRFSAKKIVCAGLAAALCIGGTAFCRECTELVPAAVSEWRRRESQKGMYRRRTTPS